MNIANNLKKARDSKNLSIEDIAQKLGIDADTYRKMEDNVDVTFGMLGKVVEVLNITVYEILNISDPDDTFLNPVVSLTKEEKENPFMVFIDFFIDYRIDEVRQFFAAMVEVCLTADSTEFNTGRNRGDLLTQYRRLSKVIEASFILAQQNTDENKY